MFVPKTTDATLPTNQTTFYRRHRMSPTAAIPAYDVFITPTLTQTPRPVGYWSMQEGDIATYLERWADAGFMFVFNLSGLPAMSVPVGLARGNTPLGLQLMGRHADETTILRVARQLEHQLEWAKRRPAIVTDNYSPQTPQQP